MERGSGAGRSRLATVSRRVFLLGGLAVGVGASLPTPGVAAVPWGGGDPFTLGIASGDPWPTGVVLWTRLVPEPLAADGRGGMPRRAVPVDWQVATDPAFRSLVRAGTEAALPERVHALHVEVDGLDPGAEYFYRFRAGPYLSPVGRTRTAPSPLWVPAKARLAVASCANFTDGWYTAYRRIAEEDPDLVLFLGDYIYEYAARAGARVRDVLGPATTTLDTYRFRYSQYKRDPDLRAAHVAEDGTPRAAFLARRAAAFEAYYEHMPLRRGSVPSGARMQLYRRLDWGRLAAFHVLDTRQYRSTLACDLAGAGAAGDLHVLRPSRRPGHELQRRRLERVRGLARPGHRRDRARARPQPGRADRRRAHAPGQRPEDRLPGPRLPHGGLRVRGHLDQLRRRRPRPGRGLAQGDRVQPAHQVPEQPPRLPALRPQRRAVAHRPARPALREPAGRARGDRGLLRDRGRPAGHAPGVGAGRATAARRPGPAAQRGAGPLCASRARAGPRRSAWHSRGCRPAPPARRWRRPRPPSRA